MKPAVCRVGTRGVTLLEIIVAVAIFAVAFTGTVSSFLTSSRLSTLTAREQVAYNAALQQKAGIIASQTEVYIDIPDKNRVYSGINATIRKYQDPANTTFAVVGLPLVQGDLKAGQIIEYLDERQVPVELGGDGTSPKAKTIGGLRYGPMDLNGDGDTDDVLSVPSNGIYGAQAVPLEVRIRFQDTGTAIVRRQFMLLHP